MLGRRRRCIRALSRRIAGLMVRVAVKSTLPQFSHIGLWPGAE
jgi:hypothetical protein